MHKLMLYPKSDCTLHVMPDNKNYAESDGIVDVALDISYWSNIITYVA